MKQEDYNSMMRSPGEKLFNRIMSHAPKCPRCGERYSGDGKALCTECAADYIDPTPEAEDDVDFVRCLACGWVGDVTAGAEACPECQAYGELQWADDDKEPV